ncbi:hypothetical protein [Kitasatospora sp. MAA19]|uniref:hypothetical protein n=1 Tax=Kitasatospora sp. MAA19 TaxID=3035090 RepID=UPI0024747E93|nr:hypothetical protein [Kitasatospora sp. MAA19]
MAVGPADELQCAVGPPPDFVEKLKRGAEHDVGVDGETGPRRWPCHSRPLPDTTAYDELLPSRRRTAPAAARETPPDPADRTSGVGTPAPHARPEETFAAVEAELLATAQVLIGDAASGLSHTTDRTLWRHLSAHARQDEMALAQVRRDTAHLARRRLRLPNTPESQRLREALTAYATTWSTTHNDNDA